MKIGVLGMGNMGRNLALNMQSAGHEVVCWNRSMEKRELARGEGLKVVESISDVSIAMEGMGRKIFFLMVSAGDGIDEVLFGDGGVDKFVSEMDIVIDGANSHFNDSKERADKFKKSGVIYLDCGISGGVEGARNGVSMMVGGEKEGYEYMSKLFSDISKPGGVGYFGESGAGHYVKMIHNAIEYGMMQAIAEGLNLLHMSEFDPDLEKVTQVWSNGSIIESNLIKYLHESLKSDGELSKISHEIGSLGTARWAVVEALKQQAPFTNIANAVFTRFESRDKDVFAQKVIQAMRVVFGAHSSTDRPNS